jgi:hypothetical protein
VTFVTKIHDISLSWQEIRQVLSLFVAEAFPTLLAAPYRRRLALSATDHKRVLKFDVFSSKIILTGKPRALPDQTGSPIAAGKLLPFPDKETT